MLRMNLMVYTLGGGRREGRGGGGGEGGREGRIKDKKGIFKTGKSQNQQVLLFFS